MKLLTEINHINLIQLHEVLESSQVSHVVFEKKCLMYCIDGKQEMKSILEFMWKPHERMFFNDRDRDRVTEFSYSVSIILDRSHLRFSMLSSVW